MFIFQTSYLIRARSSIISIKKKKNIQLSMYKNKKAEEP